MIGEREELNFEIQETRAKLLKLKKRALELDPNNTPFEDSFSNVLRNENLENYKSKFIKGDDQIQRAETFFQVGRWAYYFETESLVWSEETYKIFEFPEDFKGTVQEYYFTCVDDRSIARLPEHINFLMNSKEDSVLNQTIITAAGNKKLLSFSSTPILNDEGEIIGAKGFVKDISDKIIGKNGLDNFFNLSLDLHSIIHLDLYFVKLSPAWTKLLGYSEKELLSSSFLEFIHPDDIESTIEVIEKIAKEGSAVQFENRYLKKSGEIVYLSWNSQLDEETQLAYCNATDITKSKLDKEALIDDLNVKDLMLREIHHRIKNNLQIISSLLSLQSGMNSEEERLTKLYSDMKHRIQSMTAIHEMFYQSEELDKIELSKYLNRVTADLAISFDSADNTFDYKIDVDNVFVNLDTSIPLGLLINEIITNSMKHGASKDGDVHVFIRMKTLEDGRFEIIIGDKGANSFANILHQKTESLGVLLINSLVEQFDGDITQLENVEGTVYRLTFINRLGRRL